MTVQAYAETQGHRPKRKGTAKDFLQQFAPGLIPPGE